MRSLILVGGACLALAACDGPPDATSNIDANSVQVQVVPDDGNWVDLNTDEVVPDNSVGCPDDRKCLQDTPAKQ